MGFNSLPLESLLWVTPEALFWAKQLLSYFRPAHSTTWLGLYQPLVRVWNKKEEISEAGLCLCSRPWKTPETMSNDQQTTTLLTNTEASEWEQGRLLHVVFPGESVKAGFLWICCTNIYKCQRSWIISESDQNNLSLLTKLKKCKTNLEISLMVWFVYTLWSFPCSHFAWFSFRLKLVLIHLHFHLHLWYSFTKEDWLKSIWVFSHWT